MKSKTYIYILILIFATLLCMIGIPSLVKKATYKPDDYPFVYYSSILKEMCYVDFQDKENPLVDRLGNKYTTQQFDSLMPLLNFRQLMVDGNLPDSIDGHEITPQKLMARSVIYRYSPSKFSTPEQGLYLMYESMPKRVGMELPEDVFRMTNKIEFITDKSNTINVEKSQIFQQAIEKAGYTFPAKWLSGNMNPRKRYDEGYFSLDNNNQLFHIKMVNGRPFVRNTHISDSIDVEAFAMYEVADKRFYGFLFDKTGSTYIIEGDEGKYKPVHLEIAPIDLQNDDLLIMGNLLYWTVSVISSTGKDSYALNTETLDCIEKIHIDRTTGRWDKVSSWIFPLYLDLDHKTSDYIYPQFVFTGFKAFILNVVLALLVVVFIPNTKSRKIFQFIYIALTGIAGLIALLILPNFLNKKIKQNEETIIDSNNSSNTRIVR